MRAGNKVTWSPKNRVESIPSSKGREQDDGSIWELALFAFFFVFVFSAIARASF